MSERDHPVSALRTHVPDLERLAYNQKPKTRDWTYLRLLQYDETDLFQWFGKRNGSCFEDQASEPFRIPARRTPAPEGEAWRHVSQEEMAQAAKFASNNLASPVVPVMRAALRQRYELPTDMGAVVARLEVSASDPAPWPDLRALLKAYQEQRRALEFYADPISYALTQVSEPRSTVHGDDGKRARAALNQKGDER